MLFSGPQVFDVELGAFVTGSGVYDGINNIYTLTTSWSIRINTSDTKPLYSGVGCILGTVLELQRWE